MLGFIIGIFVGAAIGMLISALLSANKEDLKMGSVSLVNGHIDETTNYDRIRNMSVEELAQFMNDCGHDFPPYCDYKDATRGICDQNCLSCAKQWLESEVEGE